MCVSSSAILIDVILDLIHHAQISETNQRVHLNIKPSAQRIRPALM